MKRIGLHILAAFVANMWLTSYMLFEVNDLSFLRQLCDPIPDFGGHSVFGSGEYSCFIAWDSAVIYAVYGIVVTLPFTLFPVEFLRIAFIAFIGWGVNRISGDAKHSA